MSEFIPSPYRFAKQNIIVGLGINDPGRKDFEEIRLPL